MIGATASVIEGLERGQKILHITNNDLFEALDQNLWDGIDVKKIDAGIYVYKIIKRSHYIKLGNRNEILKNFIF